MPTLKRVLVGPDEEGGPSRGRDVYVVKRALRKFAFVEGAGDDFLKPRTGGFDEVYNTRTADAVEQFQKWKKLDTDGIYGQRTHDALWPYFDLYGRWTYRRFKPPIPRTEYVEPKQGFASLSRELWELFSIGRQDPYSFSDLGTYNPASRLPSGAPSDHALLPAKAFDLGIRPTTGWDNQLARQYFWEAVGRPEVHYVILGNRIWSKEKGVHSYTGGGHENHVHVSGNR